MASASSTLTSVNEFEIIEKFIRKPKSSDLIQSAGDDCSVVALGANQLLLQCSDCLVENIHFRRTSFEFADIAYKALAVNISDIAAMGGEPRYSHLSLAIPQDNQKDPFDNILVIFYWNLV